MAKRKVFHDEARDRLSVPGVATGLAVTGAGGDVLFIEVTAMDGKTGLTLTGQLAPSMSGSYVFPWLSTNPALALGFAAVAPVGAASWTPPAGFDTDTIGIWGSEDTVVPVSNGQLLTDNIDDSRFSVIKGGGHAVYTTNPNEFNNILVAWINTL